MKRALFLGGLVSLSLVWVAANLAFLTSEKALLAEKATRLNFPQPTAAALAERSMVLPEIDIHDPVAVVGRLKSLRGLFSASRRSEEFAKLCNQLIADNPLAHLETVRGFDEEGGIFYHNYLHHWSRLDPIGLAQNLD